MSQLEAIINAAWDDRANITMANASAELRDAVNHTIYQLDAGTLRVAEKLNGAWAVDRKSVV